MKKIITLIDQLNLGFAKIAGWMTALLVFTICTDVLLRYLFKSTKVWVIELEWHIFALIFLLGAAHTLKKDKHVRVDVFYQNFSEKKKALINLIGTIFLLTPWCLLIIYTGTRYGLNSLDILEGSPNPGGLPARYIIKGSIAFAFILLLLQGLSTVYKSIITLTK